MGSGAGRNPADQEIWTGVLTALRRSDVPLGRIMVATGLSKSYAGAILRGQRITHQR